MATAGAPIRPFPWRSLDSVSKKEIAGSSELRRALSRVVSLGALERAAAELLNTQVEARRRSVSRDVRPSEGGVAVVLERADEAAAPRPFVIEVEPALASALVSRALRRPAAKVIDPKKAASEPIAGAVAAVLVAVARRAGAPLRVVTAGSAASVLASFTTSACIVAAFTVMVEYDAFVARVVVTEGAPSSALPFDAGSLAALGALRLSLPIVAASSRSTAAEIGSLHAGDVWIPRAATIRREAAGWAGAVQLVAPRAERGLLADLAASGRLVLREGEGRLGWTAEGDEGDMVDKDALLESVGEVPVIVRVEIGAAEMSAREWAAASVGDVITLGRRVGEPVVLRVSGVEIARGELVEVEGEVGVRITQKTGGS